MIRHRAVTLTRAKQGALAMGDGVLACAAILFVVLPRSTILPSPLLVAVFGWILVLYALGLYDFPVFRDRSKAAPALAVALVLNAAIAAVMFLHPGAVVAAVAAHAGFAAWRLGWLRLLVSPMAAHAVAFFGDSPLIRAMVLDIRAGRHPGYRVAECRLPARPEAGGTPLERWTPGTAGPALPETPDLLVIDSALSSEGGRFAEVLSLAAEAEIPTIDDLDFYEILHRKIAPRRAARPDWLMSHVLPRKQLVYPHLKRLFDIATSAAALVFLSPLLAAAAALASSDGATPFYRQKRTGRFGKEFTIWKFRTMAVGADRAGPTLVPADHDPRITRVGGVMRRLRIDELPQFWNVLMGDMSLVGPRPEWTEVARLHQESVPCYHFRHLVRPGITGWAQVNFRALDRPDDSVEKLRYDLYYLKHMSPEFDAGILLRTVKRVFQKEESFSAGDADTAGSISP